MSSFLFVAVLILAVIAMEWVAWSAHKFIMHGFLWVLHRDHHQRSGQKSRFQRNDAFFVLFAIPSWLCIMLGSMKGSSVSVAIGAGIAVYGVAYFLVHEVFIHRRLKFWGKTNHAYWLAVRKAHKRHHRHLDKEDGECFGLLWVNREKLKEARMALTRGES
jgi:beta-carotene 3-hydroxylase